MNLSQLFKDLGTLAANAESYAPSTPDADVNDFVTAYQAQKAALAGAKAKPLDFVNNAFSVATDVSQLTGNAKVEAVVAELQKTEQDAVAGAVLQLVGELIADYKDIKAAV